MDISLQILLFISLLVLLSKALGGLSGRIGLPVVLGELIAGVILGPTLINVWRFSWFSGTTAVPGGGGAVSLAAIMNVLAGLGVVVLMFLAGLETDLEMMRRTVGPAFWSAIGGVIFTLIGGTLASHAAGLMWTESIFIGTVLTATSVSISARTLMSLEKLHSKVGSTILGAAVMDDVLSLLALSLVIALALHSGRYAAGWKGVAVTVFRVCIFSGLAFSVGPKLVRFLFRQIRHFHAPHAAVAVALVLCFAFAFLSQALGALATITGAYIAGLFVAATPARKEILNDLRPITDSFFGPLFFVSIGLQINARLVREHYAFFFAILGVAVLGKILGCGLGAFCNRFSLRDSLMVGVGMVPRGEVELIAASIGFESGLVSSEIYSLIVVLVLVTTLIAPLLLKYCPGMLEIASDPNSVKPVLTDTSHGL